MSSLKPNNQYTVMQKNAYSFGTNNHEIHNSNPDYWDILLGDLKDSNKWNNKVALDFACGKGRNVTNLHGLCKWDRVDGIDISESNIHFCRENYTSLRSNWYCNNGVDISELPDNTYDFVMSTIALQHIPVFEIRDSLIKDIYRVMKSGGVFSFQMGFGVGLDSILGKRSSYYENIYEATTTNSGYDVRVQSESEIKSHLENIGFKQIITVVRPSFSDHGHNEWIYTKCYK